MKRIFLSGARSRFGLASKAMNFIECPSRSFSGLFLSSRLNQKLDSAVALFDRREPVC